MMTPAAIESNHFIELMPPHARATFNNKNNTKYSWTLPTPHSVWVMLWMASAPIQLPIPSQIIAGSRRTRFGMIAPRVPKAARDWATKGMPFSYPQRPLRTKNTADVTAPMIMATVACITFSGPCG